MALLLIGLSLLIGVHLIPSAPHLRTRLIARLGESVYKLLFAALAIIGLVLMIHGLGQARGTLLWSTPTWGKPVAMVLMLLTFVLIVSAFVPSNIKRMTRHPMSWGIVCWTLAHLINRGDLAFVVFFGGFLVFALLMMLLANLKGATKQTQKIALSKEWVPLVAGALVYIAVLFLHPILFDVALL